MRLNRNFIALSSINQYYQTIQNKLRHVSGIDQKNVEELFKTLRYYEINDKEYFEQIMKKLGEYTEGFVLNNSFYISRLIKLTKEERQIIMVEFGNLDYSDDLKVIDMIKSIQEIFVIRVSSYIQNFIDKTDYDKEKFVQMAFDIRNNKNDSFRIQIMEEIFQIFPSINKEPIFSKLFLDMFLDINEIGYEVFKNEIAKIESQKNEVYSDYQQKAIRKAIDKKLKGN